MRSYPVGNGTLSPRVPREFAALMNALQIRGANTDALLELKDTDWEKLLDFCDLAHLTLPLAQVARTDFPVWVVRRLEKNAADLALRFERVRAWYIEVAETLEQARISHLVIKGFTQSPEYVKDPRLRFQSDLDLYCPPEYITKARGALEQIGYKTVGELDSRNADHLQSMSRPGNWTWKGNMYDPEMPVSIELHHCLWNERVNLIAIPEVKDFWDRRVIRRLENFSFPALNTVDQLGYFALHILRGIISGEWIVQHVRELAVFLQSHAEDEQFWQEWNLAHSNHLRTLESIAFSLARMWFSCTLPATVCSQIASLPAVQEKWIERYAGASLEVMFRRNKDGKLLQLLLTQSWVTRRAALRRAIIPTIMTRPGGPMVRIQNRRQKAPGNTNRYFDYLLYVSGRVLSHLFELLFFLSHGVRLCLPKRPLRSQFWLFLAVSSVLSCACQYISSSTIPGGL
jgi:Uncharacterised nucleotidyltransferase